MCFSKRCQQRQSFFFPNLNCGCSSHHTFSNSINTQSCSFSSYNEHHINLFFNRAAVQQFNGQSKAQVSLISFSLRSTPTVVQGRSKLCLIRSCVHYVFRVHVCSINIQVYIYILISNICRGYIFFNHYEGNSWGNEPCYFFTPFL